MNLYVPGLSRIKICIPSMNIVCLQSGSYNKTFHSHHLSKIPSYTQLTAIPGLHKNGF